MQSGAPANGDDDVDDHPAPRGAGASDRRPLAIALAITTVFLVVEVVGGLLTGSLALLADAGHMATDAAALALALFASWLARKPATPSRSFGFRRAEILAALANAVALVVVSLVIFWEAARRLDEPPHIDGGPMLAVAVAGLLANLASAWVLSRGGGHAHDLNTRGALLHVLGDLLGSAGAILAAVVIVFTGWHAADPILSAGIGLLVLWGAWRLMREAVDILLEATPPGLDPAAIRRGMTGVDGVVGVHDLHVWTVTSGLVALSAHVALAASADWQRILPVLNAVLRDRFGIAHATLQPEPAGADSNPYQGCTLETPEGRDVCLAPPAPASLAHAGHRH
jgi:cobalt-zinc-cadmium efflux system protein